MAPVLIFLKTLFTLGNNKALATLAFFVFHTSPFCHENVSSWVQSWQADVDVQGALSMPYKVKSKSCSSTVAGAGWRLEEQSPTVQGFSVYFSEKLECSSSLSFRAGFQVHSLTWNFELVQLGVRRLLIMIVGSFSSLCLKMEVFAPSLCECARKKKSQSLQKCALLELQNLEVVFIVLKIGESAKIGITPKCRVAVLISLY